MNPQNYHLMLKTFVDSSEDWLKKYFINTF